MKYHIYLNYNRKAEAFERPLVLIEDPDEYVEKLKRDFKVSEPAAQIKMCEYNINYVGTFDDNTGKIDLTEPNLLINLGTLLQAVKVENSEEVNA